MLQVYVWFLGCHKACVVIGILGYALLILEGVGLGLLVGSWWPDGISLMFIWYGLYYGVLGRDLAEVAGNRMVSTSYHLLSSLYVCRRCFAALLFGVSAAAITITDVVGCQHVWFQLPACVRRS